MKRIASAVGAILLALTAMPAAAEDLLPGLWEIRMQSRVPDAAGWTPEPFSITQCVTAADARDPARLIGSFSNPGATGCTYTERNYSGGTLRFAMQCEGTFGIRSTGTVRFTAGSFGGEINVKANVGGELTEFQNQISGKRLGGC